jgi:rare lipoprotein A (peptidoglycan hydrolase)
MIEKAKAFIRPPLKPRNPRQVAFVLGPILMIYLLASATPVQLSPLPVSWILKYRPMASVYERGTASWYGHPYHGRQTASGEIYDMHQLTVAHPSLPLGTRVRVKNLKNGKSVRLRVNDRGP